MKKLLFSAVLFCTAFTSFAQNDITLPKPDLTENSATVVNALATRHSVRDYDATKELSMQQISNLCWAACGLSRDDDHRTSPTARNLQEIRLFVFSKNGVYEYNAAKNTLESKAQGDHRELIVGGKGGFRQNFVMDAPVSLLMVIDFDIFGSKNENAVMMGCVDAGNVSENINLYCQAVGLATVPRATHDKQGLAALLGLTDNQLPIMNNPVGYAK